MTGPDRFVVTGSGRCGTRWMAQALTRAGIPCGHEQVYSPAPGVEWAEGVRADSSWMAAARLGEVDVPVVLMVRHPLAVVRSWMEIGFFGWDSENPTHGPLRAAFPEVYTWDTGQDRALDMWLTLTTAALSRAEIVVRLENLNADRFGRLLGWCGADPDSAAAVLAEVPPCNRHEDSRAWTGREYTPVWSRHHPLLRNAARDLASTLGYPPATVDYFRDSG